MDKKFVIIAGNFSDGFNIIGPFESFDAAADSFEGKWSETWIVELHAPENPPNAISISNE